MFCLLPFEVDLCFYHLSECQIFDLFDFLEKVDLFSPNNFFWIERDNDGCNGVLSDEMQKILDMVDV